MHDSLLLYISDEKKKREKREFLMDTNSRFLLFISKQAECIDFQS